MTLYAELHIVIHSNSGSGNRMVDLGRFTIPIDHTCETLADKSNLVLFAELHRRIVGDRFLDADDLSS